MGRGIKRKKSDYHSHHKSKKSKSPFTLEPGLKGFICTCNNREKECIRESYNILNEYADQIFGEEKWEKTTSVLKAGSSDEDDIDKALQQEVDHLKAERVKDPSLRRFQVVESGANNCLFIRTTIDDPVKLISSILKDLDETKKQKTRYLLRMLPIEATCKAWPEDIQQAVDKLLDKYFLGGEKKSFSVVFNRRNNGNVPRDEVIHDIAAAVRQRNPLHYADLKNPQYSIIVEIIRNMCCLAVVPHYFKYRRYNLLEICTVSNDKDSEKPALKQEETDCTETAVRSQDETATKQEETALKQEETCISETAVIQENTDGTSTAILEQEETDGTSTAIIKQEETDGTSTAIIEQEETDGTSTAIIKQEETDGTSTAIIEQEETDSNQTPTVKQD